MQRIIDSGNTSNKVNITGERIRLARHMAKMSQQSLSDQLELNAVYTCRGSISRIENGHRAVTDIELKAIAEILNVSFDFLFGLSDK